MDGSEEEGHIVERTEQAKRWTERHTGRLTGVRQKDQFERL